MNYAVKVELLQVNPYRFGPLRVGVYAGHIVCVISVTCRQSRGTLSIQLVCAIKMLEIQHTVSSLSWHKMRCCCQLYQRPRPLLCSRNLSIYMPDGLHA